MHLPDGFLSPPVWLALDALGLAALGLSVQRSRGRLSDDAVPRMGMLGAFVFAAQMVNMPVAGGTSGHLLGGVLIAGLLGPLPASLVMACVFTIQCLLFQDGGLLALGANYVNMGLCGTLGGWLVLRALRPWMSRDLALFLAAWCAVEAGAVLVSVELALSHTVPLLPSLLAMTGVHAIIGLLEGALSVGVVRFVARVRPHTLRGTLLDESTP